MDSPTLFHDFRAQWLLHEDAALVAIHKPCGVASQSADPARPDDVVTRLRSYLARRDDDSAPYLGVHQRLDQDASGVMLLTRSTDANPDLARQFEQRQVAKRYVVAVQGPGPGPTERTLVDHLAKGKGGLAVVVRGRDERAKKAISHVRTLRREGGRALLEVRIETGRTHQIRAQLAHAGMPLAGDRLYGGPLAPRLMLHAHTIGFEHPISGQRMTVEAQIPAVFDQWLARGGLWLPEGERCIQAAVERAAQARWGLWQRRFGDQTTDAFRLVHGEGDGLPGLFVDVYGQHLLAHLASDEAVRQRASIMAALASLGLSGVYEKVHPRQKNELARAGHAGLSPDHASWGEDAPEELIMHEWGVPYRVWLADGLRTGIFLDQRDNRRRICEMAADRSVLNLFSYTGAFSIAAAVGGACRTVSVDASKRALLRGRAGMELAGCEGEHRIVHGDAFEYLRRCKKPFDMVIVDPPTYSKTKRGRWTSGKDWRRLSAMAMTATSAGGVLLLCSNDQRMSAQRFRRYIHDGARAAGVRLEMVKDLRPPADYPPLTSGEPHLKSVLIRLAG